jgi:hypothetical protein
MNRIRKWELCEVGSRNVEFGIKEKRISNVEVRYSVYFILTLQFYTSFRPQRSGEPESSKSFDILRFAFTTFKMY